MFILSLFLFFFLKLPFLFPIYLNQEEQDRLLETYKKLNSKDIQFIESSIQKIRKKLKDPFEIRFLKILPQKEKKKHLVLLVAKQFQFSDDMLSKIQKKGFEYYNYYNKLKNFYLLYYDLENIYKMKVSSSRLGQAEYISDFNVGNYLNLSEDSFQIQLRILSVPLLKSEKNFKHVENFFLFMINTKKTNPLKLIFSYPVFFSFFNKKAKKEEVVRYLFEFKKEANSKINYLVLNKVIQTYEYKSQKLKKNLEDKLKKQSYNSASKLFFYYDKKKALMRKKK